MDLAKASDKVVLFAKSFILPTARRSFGFNGDLKALNGVTVRQPGAKFSQNAWKAMRKIAAGKTLSYAELAKHAGSPDAVRAAGTACGNNLIAPIVPCHRIVKSGGALGNYGYGVKIKEWLLSHEGAL